MLELGPSRKNKINLLDYPVRQDIENRMLMSDFSTFDLRVLEEILFSSLKISFRKLLKNLDATESTVQPILEKLSKAGLLTLQKDEILVDKEGRKYFEFQLTRFQSDFCPDMEFVQGILRKVPIHILPSWYSIPRTSNNIFQSIFERYLMTPQLYQRYLLELNFQNPMMSGIIDDLFCSPALKLSSSDVVAKYNLTPEALEEIMLLLEFNFVCCTVYEEEEDHFSEWITPFHEWKEYLLFIRKTEASTIDETLVKPKRKEPFAFIKDAEALLLKKPHSLDEQTLLHLKEKLTLLDLWEKESPLPLAKEWLKMNLEERALYFYRHPKNTLLSAPCDISLLREAEKVLKRASHKGWVLFDIFLQGALVHIDEDSKIVLKKMGKHWKYTLPTYNEEAKKLLKATVFEWFFEMGMVNTGTTDQGDAFSLTPFGKAFFQK